MTLPCYTHISYFCTLEFLLSKICQANASRRRMGPGPSWGGIPKSLLHLKKWIKLVLYDLERFGDTP